MLLRAYLGSLSYMHQYLRPVISEKPWRLTSIRVRGTVVGKIYVRTACVSKTCFVHGTSGLKVQSLTKFLIVISGELPHMPIPRLAPCTSYIRILSHTPNITSLFASTKVETCSIVEQKVYLILFWQEQPPPSNFHD